MNLAILIPFHADLRTEEGQHRQAVWDYLRPFWESLPYTLIVGSDPFCVDGRPFSVARATNHAASHAPPEVDAFATFGADHVPDPIALRWIEHRLQHYAWTRVFHSVSYLNEQQTRHMIHMNYTPDWAVWPPATEAPCPGVVGVHRTRWDAVGGMNGKYEGWGWEDNDLTSRLAATSAGGPAQEVPLRELWHHTGHRDMSLNNPNRKLYNQEWGMC